MNIEIVVSAAGGLALFLLAMVMMTEGLTVSAGSGLKRLLARWTSTPLRGVAAGILVTGLVQSSSAVTVATIGFVNAGVLTLRQALGVIFGTNVGTTVTGWLVSLVGIGFKIEGIALPILTVGVLLRLMGPGGRWRGLGQALAGFGLFFLGLSILKDAFEGLATAFGSSITAGGGAGLFASPTFVFVGFLATVLTQSSSAAIAIILTAATGGVVSIEAAGAAVIGANLGTTSTAAAAVFKATPAAKRLALGHIAFNLITGVIALGLLPMLLWLVGRISHILEIQDSPATALAIFHTMFNLLGVALMLPLSGRLSALLERLFRSHEEDIRRAQHLDRTLVGTPALASLALREELLRLRSIVSLIVKSALSGAAATPELERQASAVKALGDAVREFVSEVRVEGMPEDVSAEITRSMYTTRYLQEGAYLAPNMHFIVERSRHLTRTPIGDLLQRLVAATSECLTLNMSSEFIEKEDEKLLAALENFRQVYADTKTNLLNAAVKKNLSVEIADELLDALSLTRRAVEQLVKAGRLFRGTGPIAVVDVYQEQL